MKTETLDLRLGPAPDWAPGFDTTVPCIWQGCDREVEWFGNQHGCIRGHCCNAHLRLYMNILIRDLSTRRYIPCRRCHEVFRVLPHFFTAVRA